MSRIVFTWELGGGMGHIQRILPLARRMQARKHEVICVMQHVIYAENILGDHNIKIIQAPVWQLKVKKLSAAYNYSDILFNCGYLFRDNLISMAKAWRSLFDLLKPDLIIADYSPTALVATHGSDYKRAVYGNGFFTPPLKSPLPSITPWGTTPEGILEKSENKALEIINSVLKELGSPLLQKLYELFEVDENILATFKELDHYQDREPTKYWGPIVSFAEGEKPRWPQEHIKRHKIFCYLKPNYPLLGKLLDELTKVDASVIIYSPYLPDKVIKKLQGANLLFLKKPANMKKVCAECDLVICHASHGTCAVSLLHGKPLLLLPEHDHLEQMLTAYNLARSQYGIMATTYMKEKSKAFKIVIENFLNSPIFAEQAKQFAEKYKDFNPTAQVEKIADRCEELINAA